MSIVSRGRRGSTIVPNWRWEDPELDPYELRIAGWLASHTDSYRGTLTRNKVAEATGVSQGKVSGALIRLAELGIIDVVTVDIPQSQGGRRLSITFDWEVWEGADPGHEMTRPRSPHDQDPGHHMTSTRGLQEEEQERTPCSPPSGLALAAPSEQPTVDDDGFDDFWEQYPRKTAKKNARSAWKRLAKKDRVAALQALPAHKAQWREPKYIPHPATWLNGRRWEDELRTAAPTGWLSDIEAVRAELRSEQKGLNP